MSSPAVEFNGKSEDPSSNGRSTAELLPLVYDRLRSLAHRQVGMERPGQTLQGTALVHEAFVRLMHGSNGGERRWTDQWHFYAAAAETMRRILVDAARRRGRLKRGVGRKRVELNHVTLEAERSGEELLAINEALTQFAVSHAEKAQLVQLRYFAGLTSEQAAAAMKISNSTADRYWAFAKAWLYRRVAASEGSDEPPSQ